MSVDDSDNPHKNPPEGGNGRPRRPKKRRRLRAPESTIAIFDRLLMRQRSMILNGVQTNLPTIDAIAFQLWLKSMDGDIRARNVLLKWEKFASRRTKRRLEVRWADNDDTRVIRSPDPGDEDE